MWEIKNYQYNKEKKQVETQIMGRFVQYPMKLAWAVTIHKSQGKTFEKIYIDLANGAFAHGQVYVALSRCKSLDGVFLRRPLRQEDILVDRDILNYSP